MQLIILAAGRGTRLMPFTQDVPKCLVEIERGTTLLELQLAEVELAGGIDGVTLVTGYRADLVAERVGGRRSSLPVEIVVNRDFDTTNALYSLWLAMRHRRGEFLVLNGDTLVRASTIRRVLGAPREEHCVLAYSSGSTLPVDAVKVAVAGGRLRTIGKELDGGIATGESVGLARFVGRGASEAVMAADDLVREEGGAKAYWYTLIRRLASVGTVHVIDCPVDEWFEVDRPADLERVRAAIRGSSRDSKRGRMAPQTAR